MSSEIPTNSSRFVIISVAILNCYWLCTVANRSTEDCWGAMDVVTIYHLLTQLIWLHLRKIWTDEIVSQLDNGWKPDLTSTTAKGENTIKCKIASHLMYHFKSCGVPTMYLIASLAITAVFDTNRKILVLHVHTSSLTLNQKGWKFEQRDQNLKLPLMLWSCSFVWKPRPRHLYPAFATLPIWNKTFT